MKSFWFGPCAFAVLVLMTAGCGGGDECSGLGMEMCGGVCVDTTSNASHCGGCGNACPTGAACVNSSCDCTGAGTEMCNNQCVNTMTDNAHCGGCNRPCLGGGICSGGSCTCTGGLTYCVDRCVNTKTDDSHCGGCLQPCAGGKHCINGSCVTPYEESCDGVDNDFDGQTDEDANGQPLKRPCDNLCGPGQETCTGGTWQNCTAPAPQAEACDGDDDDCDGLIDDGVTTTYFEDYDLDGYGDPDEAYSTQACSKPADGTSPNGGNWSENNTDCNDGYPCYDDQGTEIPCDPEQIYPNAAESCNGVDDDCDNNIDEGINCQCTHGEERACGTDVGECNPGTQTCTNGVWGECGGTGYVPPQPAEICDGKDNDCDGKTDEELADDAWETNDSCSLARQTETVFEDDPWLDVEELTIYHGTPSSPADQDWFLVHAEEVTHLECIVHPGEYQCNFKFAATLTVPASENHENYVYCINAGGNCNHFEYTFCSDDPDSGTIYNPDTHTYTMVLTWDGICGLDDSWDFYVQVKGNTDVNLNSCNKYRLGFRLTYDGPIGESCD